jgi:beta-glucosidase
MMRISKLSALTFSAILFTLAPAWAAQPAAPWMNTALNPDQRAALLERAMTPDEHITLLHGYWASPDRGVPPSGAIGSAGYVPGVPRLGIPALQETDASIGVANPGNVRRGDGATSLPSSIATAASFDPQMAYDGGAMIATEAWHKGFNVLLGGGVNLARDPRNGRNFEYLGEDPLLAGTLDGAAIRGIQDQHVISTVKHFAMNDQETNRYWANSKIDTNAARESDLLAFELAIEGGHPGSVMCAYNLVNSIYSCGSDGLLNGLLKGDWKFPGWVMSDWGAVHDAKFANFGLDQESGQEIDAQIYFDQPLRQAIAAGTVSSARISDMTRRILRAMFAVGVFDHPPVKSAIDYNADAAISQRNAEEGIVLLKNASSILPLAKSVTKIAVIGAHADAGVLSGGGSSQVLPKGGSAIVPLSGVGTIVPFAQAVYDLSSPLTAIIQHNPRAQVRFDDGRYLSSAASLAKWADVVIVFADQWMSEGFDAPDITLPEGQDSLIASVAAANQKTIVVLETGGPVQMPWLDNVNAVIEAWYPGGRGGEAIANVLFGDVNPSGHLPVTFPQSMAQNPRPDLPGVDVAHGVQFDVNYSEGASVGYRWFAERNLTPLFPFGFGLSYTNFAYNDLAVQGGTTLSVAFDVKNTGAVAGAAVPQVYLMSANGAPVKRLIGFSRIVLQSGETHRISVSADPRFLGSFDATAHTWRVSAGSYKIAVGSSSADTVLSGAASLQATSPKP